MDSGVSKEASGHLLLSYNDHSTGGRCMLSHDILIFNSFFDDLGLIYPLISTTYLQTDTTIVSNTKKYISS